MPEYAHGLPTDWLAFDSVLHDWLKRALKADGEPADENHPLLIHGRVHTGMLICYTTLGGGRPNFCPPHRDHIFLLGSSVFCPRLEALLFWLQQTQMQIH